MAVNQKKLQKYNICLISTNSPVHDTKFNFLQRTPNITILLNINSREFSKSTSTYKKVSNEHKITLETFSLFSFAHKLPTYHLHNRHRSEGLVLLSCLD